MIDRSVTEASEMKAASATVYVYLLDEGTDVWRPVSAEWLGDSIYRIVSGPPAPEDEKWEFAPGEIVRCRHQKLAGGRHLIAYERVMT